MATIEEQLLAKILEIGTADTADSITPTMVEVALDLLRQLSNEHAEALSDNIQGFRGITNEPDSLTALTSYGIYYNTQYWRGLLAVVFDHNNVISQVALSSSTPSYSGNTVSWVSGPCVMMRTYSSGSWSHWGIVDGGLTLAADAVGDLDLSDPNGNILVRFENGHIRTCHFYSGDVYTKAQVNALINASGINIATVNGLTLTNGGNVKTTSPYLRWHGKKVGALGDSITAGYNTTKTYLQYLADELEFTPVNYGSNSSEIASSSSNGFITRAGSIATDLDMLLILGGVNDFLWAASGFQIGEVYTVSSGSLVMNTDTTTFCGAYNTLLQTIVARIPGKPIYLMTPLHTANFGSQNVSSWKKNNAGQTLSQFVDAIKAVGRFWGFPVIDLYAEAGMNPNIEALRVKFYNHYVPDSQNNDSLHPDTNGHKRIAETILLHI